MTGMPYYKKMSVYKIFFKKAIDFFMKTVIIDIAVETAAKN